MVADEVGSVRIAVLGEYQADRVTHPATTAATGHAAACLGLQAQVEWVGTDAIEGRGDVLAGYDGIWMAPGSPYRSLTGALEAITAARTGGIPLLGTCGGFQHIVLEYARSVLGVPGAGHAEYSPDGDDLFITALSCSLAGRPFAVRLTPATKAARAYGTESAEERYYCNFGLNPKVIADLRSAGLVTSGTDADGEVRIVELSEHPFFVGTLFVPQVSSAPGRPHPLVVAFVVAAYAYPHPAIWR